MTPANMKQPVKMEDLLEAFEFVSAGPAEMEAYFCRDTGVIHFYSADGGFEDDLPDDIDDVERYVAIPDQNALDLGRRLALKFVKLELSDDFSDVYDFFRRKGAYPRFKALLERRGKLQQWYEYEESRKREALCEWCVENEIQIAQDPPHPGT